MNDDGAPTSLRDIASGATASSRTDGANLVKAFIERGRHLVSRGARAVADAASEHTKMKSPGRVLYLTLREEAQLKGCNPWRCAPKFSFAFATYVASRHYVAQNGAAKYHARWLHDEDSLQEIILHMLLLDDHFPFSKSSRPRTLATRLPARACSRRAAPCCKYTWRVVTRAHACRLRIALSTHASLALSLSITPPSLSLFLSLSLSLSLALSLSLSHIRRGARRAAQRDPSESRRSGGVGRRGTGRS